MDREAAQLAMMRIVERLSAERRIADARIEMTGGNHDVLQATIDMRRAWVEMPRNLGCQWIELDRREMGRGTHRRRHESDEIADAGGRLEDAAAVEPDTLQALVDTVDDGLRRVVRVLCRSARTVVLIFGEKAGELEVFVLPVLIAMVERLRQAAPAYVAHEDRLFVRRRDALLITKLQEQLQCGDVVTILRLGAALPEPV